MDGWMAEEKRRDQHGTNCFLCTPAEPLSAIHQPAAIGPAPTLWQMRPSSHSIHQDSSNTCRCVFDPERKTDRVCMCLDVRMSEHLYDIQRDENVFVCR